MEIESNKKATRARTQHLDRSDVNIHFRLAEWYNRIGLRSVLGVVVCVLIQLLMVSPHVYRQTSSYLLLLLKLTASQSYEAR